MSLVDTINTDIKSAMKAKEKEKLTALRAIKSALLLEASKEVAGAEISEEVGMKILLKMQKQRSESADLYRGQNREEEAAQEDFESSVIANYLPAALTEEEIEATVKETIAKVGATSMADMGKVMGMASKAMPTADGKVISAMVKKLLG